MNTKIWERKDLKQKGKAAFKLNYWKCVLVALILGLVGGSSGGGGGTNTQSISQNIENASNGNTSGISEAFSSIPAGAWAAVAVIIIFAIALGICLAIFLLNPLALGCYRFFEQNHYSPADLSELGYGFTHNYKNNIKTLFFRDLYIFLWSLLFVIPGIVKSYSYRMVPYIMSENPELSTEEVLALSKEMMNGQKWNAFVLDLSFLGWILLSILTLGILAIFYVSPYMEATNAELYHALKPVSDDTYTIEDNTDANYAV